jgi:SAM-dependent methyltransferase
MKPDSDAIAAHYGPGDLAEAILAGARAAGKDPDHLQPDDLTPVDQFHMGGRPATLELIRLAGLPRGGDVLDIGGGFGGPARTLAVELDGRVVVLDITEEFCRVGEMLTARTGLGDRVRFQHGDATAMPFDDASFDAAWTQHSSMNIADKEQLYREIKRVLRPGGRLALHEVMAGPEQPIHFPVPWARDATINALRPAAEARALIAGLGFDEVAWVDVSAASIDWWRERLAIAAGQPGPPPLGLHLILGPDFGQMVRNMLRNLEENRITVVQAAFARP